MKLSTFLLIILITFNFTNLNSEENNDKIKNKISKNIRCLICQGQSVYDSESDFAVSIKLIIDKKLNEGLNENEIYDFLKNQYGDWIVYDKQRSPTGNFDDYVLLNTTGAQGTTGGNWVTPTATGFDTNGSGGGWTNANGDTYLYLAFKQN